MSRHLAIITTSLLLLASVSKSQDYYYSDNRKISFEKAKHWIVVQVGEIDRPGFEDRVKQDRALQIVQALDRDYGIYWLETTKDDSIQTSINELANEINIIRKIPAYFSTNEQGDTTRFIMSDEFRAKFHPHITVSEIEEINAEYAVEIVSSNRYNEYTLRVKEESLLNTLELANLYYESEITVWSLPDFLADIRLDTIYDDLYPDQWHLENTGQGGGTNDVDIDAEWAWDITTGSSSIIIAIIDGGVEDHDDFHTGQLITGYTARTGGDGSQASGNTEAGKHGQSVAGLAAAAFNTEGVRGVTDNVKIMPIRIFDIARLTYGDIADAIDTAWTRGADVLNNSWGVSSEGFYNDDVADAIYRALTEGRDDKGSLVVKSAGNTGDYVTFPGTVPGVLVVGGVTNENDPYPYTPEDPEVDVVAPTDGGTLGITTMDRMGSNGYNSNGDYYSNFGGTSAAAPQVSGLGALILSLNPDLEARSVGVSPNPQVQNTIKLAADDYGITNWDGHGRINAYRCVLSAKYDVKRAVTGEISGTISDDIVLYGNVTITDNLVVNAGTRMAIHEGANIKIYSNKMIQVFGTLIAQGIETNKIVFSRYGTSGTWTGIQFENSSSDEDCIVEWSDISQASNGIRCNYASPRIRNNTISNCSYGLDLYNSSPQIEYNKIISNSTGIYGDNWNSSNVYDNAINDNASKGMRLINSSSPILYHASIKRNGGNGVVASSASAPEFGAKSSTEKGRNVILDHNANGIRAYGISDVFLGSDNIGGQERGGYNAVYDNGQYNIYVSQNTEIIAENNYWVDTLKFKIGAGSSLDFKPYLDYNPYGGSSLGKVQQNVSIDLISLDTNSVIGLDNLARKLWFEGNFLDAIEAYKKLIREFPDSLQAKHALVRVMSLYKKTGGGWFSGYLENLTENQVSRELSDLALSLLIVTYTNDMEFDRAISTIEHILSNSPSAVREYESLFNLFNIYFTGLSDTVKAAEVLGVLKDRYPDYELTQKAQEDMGEAVDWSLAKDLIEENIPPNKTMQLPTDFALEPNYPNPFNPTTTIRFALPEAGEVSLVVYDLMGREVVRLADGHLEAGWREVVWDGLTANGREVPTGLYIARLVTPQGTKAIKLVMMK